MTIPRETRIQTSLLAGCRETLPDLDGPTRLPAWVELRPPDRARRRRDARRRHRVLDRRPHPLALVAVVLLLAVNWFGDSLDGTLARVRHQERPRYGFYVDHVLDVRRDPVPVRGPRRRRLHDADRRRGVPRRLLPAERRDRARDAHRRHVPDLVLEDGTDRDADSARGRHAAAPALAGRGALRQPLPALRRRRRRRHRRAAGDVRRVGGLEHADALPAGAAAAATPTRPRTARQATSRELGFALATHRLHAAARSILTS